MNQQDAAILLVQWLRSPNHGGWGSYGYDVYLPALIRTYLEKNGVKHQDQEIKLREIIPAFYAAAWDLCRRGILRPGVHSYGAQSTDDGSAGNGYSVTPFGERWLEEADKDDFVPTEPGRFAEMLETFREQFGPGFYERAQEAVRCYGAHAYLACCAMCGAATESIMLSTAVAKKGEEEVLKVYIAANGRSKIENMIIGQAKEHLQREYRGYVSLVKYWRDESAHGKQSGITDNEAYTSLALLLRFAHFVNDNWAELVQNV